MVITYLLLGKPATFSHTCGKRFAVAAYGDNMAAGIYSKAFLLVVGGKNAAAQLLTGTGVSDQRWQLVRIVFLINAALSLFHRLSANEMATRNSQKCQQRQL